MNKRRGLGRGLEALIPSGEYVEELSDNRARRRFALQIAIAEIKPNPEQPRRAFDAAALQELADSIRIHGILQPLLVREGLAGYELIAGHGIALLGLPTPVQQLVALERVIREKWSVRQTEEWVRARATEAGTRQPRRRAATTDPETRAVEEEFRRALGTKVVLTRLKQGGRLTIEFYSNDELESLRRRLTR